jgi:hypothetical protein
MMSMATCGGCRPLSPISSPPWQADNPASMASIANALFMLSPFGYSGASSAALRPWAGYGSAPVPFMTAAMTVAPKGLNHAGRQARGHADADQHEERSNLEFPERLHRTSSSGYRENGQRIVFWGSRQAAIVSRIDCDVGGVGGPLEARKLRSPAFSLGLGAIRLARLPASAWVGVSLAP